MISLTLSFIIFLVISLISFTSLGIFLLDQSKIKFKLEEKFLIGTVVGFVFFTLLSYFLIMLKVGFLVWPIIFYFNFRVFNQLRTIPSTFKLKVKKTRLILFIVFALGIIGQLAIIAPSGLLTKTGDLVFYSAHGHDGPWHIALMNEISKGLPLNNPVFAGERLVNYHFFSDIAPAVFLKFFHFSSLDLYFRFFPFIFSLLLGSAAYFLGRELGKTHQAGLWSTIFTFFGGSFGYLATLYLGRGVGGESIFWATQVQSSSGNPPQIISNIIILTFLYLLLKFLTQPEKPLAFSLIILAGTLAVFKVYAAIVLLGSLGLAAVWQLIRKRNPSLLILTLFSGLLSAVLYFPNSTASTSFLIFQPWWYIRTMIVEPSRLNWIDHELRRQHYLAHYFPKAWARVIQLELTAFLIFFFGNLGTRFIGLIEFVKRIKSVLSNYFNLVFLSLILLSIILPLLFLQKGVASNTSQFLQYFILLFGILAGMTTSQIINKIKPKFIKIAISLIILLFTVPTQAALIYDFYKRPPLAKITKEELEALAFLKNNSPSDSVILTPPYNQYFEGKDVPPHIWDWFDTSYVAAFTNRLTYFDDYEQVDILGYDFESRKQIKEDIFNTTSPEEFASLIKKTNADYLYFPKVLSPTIDFTKTTYQEVFENNSLEVWKI